MIYKLVYCLFQLSVFKCSLSANQVWGPGLKPDVIVMPARYFFVQIYESCLEKLLDVQIYGMTSSSRKCRIWKEILNTKNCVFIVRYKLYETCENLTIDIEYDHQNIGKSPYHIKNRVYFEDCYCPNVNLKQWLINWECGDVPRQIIMDLNRFKSVNFDDLRDEIIKKYDSPGAISLCHYIIKNNLIYRRCRGKYVDYKMFMDEILLSLSRKLFLPDTELFVNLGDWPLVKNVRDKFPIFSWCGSTDSYDIVMPTYDLTKSTLENMGRVTLDMLSVQGNTEYDWEDRIPKLFWRGRDSNRERLRLIELSREHPHLLNVSLTNFFFFRDEERRYGPKSDHVSFFKFFDYKYQLSIDGTVAAYRLPYLLGGGSLLIKQTSKYYEHFYNLLKPYIHYVPVKNDLTDLIEKINWAIENDEQSEKIATTGRQFAIENLLPKDVFCYYAHLLSQFTKKIINKVRVSNNMELVKNNLNNNCNCETKIKDEL